MANQEVSYKVPVTMRDKLEILVWIESVGNKSMTYAYEAYKIVGGERVIAATAKTVLVSFDVSSGRSIEVPQEWRDIITKNNLLGKPSV